MKANLSYHQFIVGSFVVSAADCVKRVFVITSGNPQRQVAVTVEGEASADLTGPLRAVDIVWSLLATVTGPLRAVNIVWSLLVTVTSQGGEHRMAIAGHSDKSGR